MVVVSKHNVHKRNFVRRRNDTLHQSYRQSKIPPGVGMSGCDGAWRFAYARYVSEIAYSNPS